jgi:hypothetical protein
LHEPQVYCFCPTRFLNQMIFKVVSAVTWWVPLVKQDYLPLWSTRTHSRFLIRFVLFFSSLCCALSTISFWSLYCPS